MTFMCMEKGGESYGLSYTLNADYSWNTLTKFGIKHSMLGLHVNNMKYAMYISTKAISWQNSWHAKLRHQV